MLLYKAWDVKRVKRKAIVADGFDDFVCKAGAIIGDGDRKRGVHAAPSKKTNVLFLEKIAPPSTS